MSYARWATKEEILEQTKKVTKEGPVEVSGIPVMYDEDSAYISKSAIHNLIVGGTGSGKTQSIVLPEIYLAIRAGESFIVNDNRGEIYEKMSGFAQKNGYKVEVIDLVNMNKGCNFNPLYLPYKLFKEDKIDASVELLENVGYNLISDNGFNDADPFWENSAISLFVGLAIYLFCRAKEDEININSIANLVDNLDAVKEDINNLEKAPIINTFLTSILNAPTDTKGSIIAVFKQKIRLLTSREALSKLLASNNIELGNIKNEKTALFIIGDGKYSKFITPMIFNQVCNIIKLNNNSNNKLRIMLDDFDELKPINGIYEMLTDCRSLGIKVTAIIKSFLCLIDKYGEKNSEFVKMAFGNTVFLLANDIETLNRISQECGRKSETESLITVEELKVLKPFEAVILMNRMYPIKTKLVPYFEFNIETIEPVEQKQLEYTEVKLYK